jgi:hypothetical protein
MQALTLLLLGIVLGQAPPMPTQTAAIEAAKNSIVRDIEDTLPRMTFEAWLRREVGPRAVMKWEVNDCGEQTGTPADRGRDFPVCVEVQVDLAGNRQLSLSLVLGTIETGVKAGQAKFYDGYLGAPTHAEKTWIKKLSQVQALIAQ